MKFLYSLLVLGTALLPVCSGAQATQSTSTKASSAPTVPATKKPAAVTSSTPSSQEIAEAKAKGLVWANENTKVYHKEGSLYGTTKHGKFMTEADAQKAGYHLAKTNAGSKKAKTTATGTAQ